MNLKDRNNASASRFGFRSQQAKISSDNDPNVEVSTKKVSLNSGDCVTTKNLTSKHVTGQSCASTNEPQNHSKAKKNSSRPCSDQCSAASNGSDSSLCTKSTSSNTGSARKGCNAPQPILHCSRGHILQMYDPESARRSRSRDAGGEVKSRFESKERPRMRDQSLKSAKMRSKSRDPSSGRGGRSISTKSPINVCTNAFPPGKSPVMATRGHSVLVSKKGSENCHARDSENNLIDQASLKSDLNFLRKKLLELRSVLSAGAHASSEGDVSTIKEENCMLREENVQLKEKIKTLELQLNLKLQEINEMNEKFITVADITASQHVGAKTLHDLSTNIPDFPKGHDIQNSKEMTKLTVKDRNDNISHTDNFSTETSKLIHDNRRTHKPPCEIMTENQLASKLSQQKIKKPSQLPTKPSKRWSSIPKNNLKTGLEKDITLENRIHDKIAFGQHNTEETRHVPNIRSARVFK